MSSGLEEDLTCAVCCEHYEENSHEPVVLPQCGHTFCRPCLLHIEENNSTVLCPNCRAPHLGLSVPEMPTIYALLSVSKKTKLDLQGNCRFHGIPKELWCRDCSIEMCETCHSQQKKDKRKCSVVDIKVVIQENKDEIFEKVKQVKLQIDKEKECLNQRLNAITKEFLAILKQSKDLKEFVNEVHEQEKIASSAQELFVLKKVLCDIKSIYCQVSETTKGMSEGETLSQATDQQDITDFMINNADFSEFMTEAWNLSQNIVNFQKDKENFTPWIINKLDIDTLVNMPKLPWNSIISQFPLVQLFVPLEIPEVFLDLTLREISLGRVTIRLWGHMKRAQQFLALCLGTFGPTYKGSSFYRVQNNSSGRFVIGGYYNTDKEVKSAHGLMSDLEWDGQYRLKARKGLVAGWSYQDPGLEAIFGFACGDSYVGDLFCPFGEVLSGMTVLNMISLREDVTEVMIADCGLVTL